MQGGIDGRRDGGGGLSGNWGKEKQGGMGDMKLAVFLNASEF